MIRVNASPAPVRGQRPAPAHMEDPACAAARAPRPSARAAENYDLPAFDEWAAARTLEEKRAGA